ncbi:L-dopachrome tautomerase yellow-f2-like [Anopheles darlingi]|uniref:L-dopachrome tautomerase yellow-f2-like n=1 Tax=Anopheles darlingi TaxID=43151 RepID=UPI0021000B9F|nr:L-dopachrome tautomerase yellow-f2-like [Anopheles darlingi]
MVMVASSGCVAALILTIAAYRSTAIKFEKVFEWKQLTFADLPEQSREIFDGAVNETFQPYGNMPMGVVHHKQRLFISIPRRRPGIPATLTVIDLSTVPGGNRSPPLFAYPSHSVNQLQPGYRSDLNRLVSVYRTRVDACERLWFIDTGTLNYPDNPVRVQDPQLWIIDLRHDRVVHRYLIPDSIVFGDVGMVSLTVDVESTDCARAYAYIPDLVSNAIYVYSLQDDDMWVFSHSSFAYDPSRSQFHVAGLDYEWDDGVFSIAIGQNDTMAGSKLIFYHPMVSTTEFGTYASVLQSKRIAMSHNYDELFQPLGERGPNTQSTMHHYDPQTGVLFYAQVARNAIGCWNTRQIYGPDTHAVVHQDDRELVYPSDLSSDSDGTLWVLTNNMPIWMYSRLNESDYNFRVWKQSPAIAIQGTKCDN